MQVLRKRCCPVSGPSRTARLNLYSAAQSAWTAHTRPSAACPSHYSRVLRGTLGTHGKRRRSSSIESRAAGPGWSAPGSTHARTHGCRYPIQSVHSDVTAPHAGTHDWTSQAARCSLCSPSLARFEHCEGGGRSLIACAHTKIIVSIEKETALESRRGRPEKSH